jgi:hypothetical protein
MSKPILRTVPQTRQTYFMVASEVIFRAKDAEVSNTVLLNTLVISKDGKFPVTLIAKAQQATQFQFFKRMEDPTLVVLDVVIIALMNLGQFTDAEFNAAPEGMAMVETSDVLGGEATRG